MNVNHNHYHLAIDMEDRIHLTGGVFDQYIKLESYRVVPEALLYSPRMPPYNTRLLFPNKRYMCSTSTLSDKVIEQLSLHATIKYYFSIKQICHLYNMLTLFLQDTIVTDDISSIICMDFTYTDASTQC